MKYYFNSSLRSLLEQGAISTRTYNCLYSVGLESIADVIAYSANANDFMRIKGFGLKSRQELANVLSNIKGGPDVAILHFAKDDSLLPDINKCYEQAYETVFSGEGIIEEFIRGKYPSWKDLLTGLKNGIAPLLKVVPDFTREQHILLRTKYNDYLQEVIRRASQQSLDIQDLERLSAELSAQIDVFSEYEHAHYFMDKLQHERIEAVYQRMSEENLKVRARNFRKIYLPSFENLITYFDLPLAAYRDICPGQSMHKTLKDIYDFTQKFKVVYRRLVVQTREEVLMADFEERYFYLMNEQRDFVKDFIAANSHAPLFYVVYHYLKQSQARVDKMFCLRHGVFDGKKCRLDDIALEFGVTRERVRQVLERPTTARNILDKYRQELRYYSVLLSSPFVCEQSDAYLRISAQEKFDYGFDAFAAILSIMSNFKIEEIHNSVVAINKTAPIASVDLKKCVKSIERSVRQRYPCDTEIPLETVAGVKLTDDGLKELMTYIVSAIFDHEVNDGKVSFAQNSIDVAFELYQILAQKGSPMGIEELFTAFKQKYPDHKFTNINQLRPYVGTMAYAKFKVKPIGNQSLYGLEDWDNIYFGSIRDLMSDTLNASDVPLHINDIFDAVVKYFPKTSVKSIDSSMQSDTRERFISFGKDLWGLKGKDYGVDYVVSPNSRKRNSFVDRLEAFRQFVDTNHRFPQSNNGEEEASLKRWYYNVENGIITPPSDDVLNQYKLMIEGYAGQRIPRTAYEVSFLEKCEAYKQFILTAHQLPTTHSNQELSYWFKHVKDNQYDSDDYRGRYLKDLTDFIRSYNFTIP